MAASPLDLSPEWEAALARAAGARRVAILGPTDAGKSTFLHALAARTEGLGLLDLDPGQKMIGPPGTASAGRLASESAVRFVFLGSTAVASFTLLAAAARQLATETAEPFAINTPGYVAGPGARLQAMILDALRPDLVVLIGDPPALEPLSRAWPTLRVARSPSAVRKSAGKRRAVRQEAFAAALRLAEAFPLPPAILFEPAPPAYSAELSRPVCALADDAGEDMALGVLVAPDRVFAPPTPRAITRVRLGRMWAAAGDDGWTLLERLAPSWAAPTAP